MEGIKTAGETIGNGLTSFLNDPAAIGSTAAALAAIALGVYAARYSFSGSVILMFRSAANVAGQYVSSRLGKV
jgi:ATPase family AAA domain-containing protein 3A/B